MLDMTLTFGSNFFHKMNFSNGELRLKTLDKSRGDLLLIHRWLSDEKVIETFGGRDNKRSLKDVEKEFIINKFDTPAIIFYREKPVGFIELFAFDEEQNISHGLQKEELQVLCVDIVIGEITMQNKGIGRQAIIEILKNAFEKHQATKVVLDTLPWHFGAIKCYENCGFKITRTLKDHNVYEGELIDNIFMEINREEFDRS